MISCFMVYIKCVWLLNGFSGSEIQMNVQILVSILLIHWNTDSKEVKRSRSIISNKYRQYKLLKWYSVFFTRYGLIPKSHKNFLMWQHDFHWKKIVNMESNGIGNEEKEKIEDWLNSSKKVIHTLMFNFLWEMMCRT